jgi:hypothetical protein
VLSGESCIREVAAYLLDSSGFSSVPSTTFVEVVHNSFKYVPFTGLEVTGTEYFEIMSSLIKPDNDDVEETKNSMLTKTPESQASTQNHSNNVHSIPKAGAGKEGVAVKISQEN